MQDRRYGQPEGLHNRLLSWIERMSMDQSLPWVGLGLIDDLKLAVTLIPLDFPTAPATVTKDFDL